MLTGVSKATILEEWHTLNSTPYQLQVLSSNTQPWWKVAIILANRHMGHGAGDMLHSIGARDTLGADSPTLPAKGKGLIRTWQSGLSHAVAFEDGMVYDPALDGPISWTAWRDLYPDDVVIIPMQEKELDNGIPEV